MWEHTVDTGHTAASRMRRWKVHNYFKFKITYGDLIYWPEKLESVKVT